MSGAHRVGPGRRRGDRTAPAATATRPGRTAAVAPRLPPVDATCGRHPDAAATALCASCGLTLCGACWRHEVDRAPWCEPCVALVCAQGQGTAPAVALGLAALVAGAGVWRVWRAELAPVAERFWLAWLAGTAVAVLWAGSVERSDWKARIARRHALPEDEPPAPAFERRADAALEPGVESPALRPRAEAAAPFAAGPGATVAKEPLTGGFPHLAVGEPRRRPGPHPYRVAWRRATRSLAAPASGFWTSVVVLACLAVAALAVPRALALPGWIEVELVLLSGWAVLLVALAVLLQRGWRLADDHVLSPVSLPGGALASTAADAGLSGVGCLAEGAFGAIGLMLVAGSGLLALWVMVELALPFLFLLAYLVVRGALARVVNDRHGCEGHWPRALAWGALWATVYVAPLAAAVTLLR